MNTAFAPMILFSDPMSSQCYSVKLFLSLQDIDFIEKFDKIAPLKPQDIIPELQIGDTVIEGVTQCLQYLQQQMPTTYQIDLQMVQKWQDFYLQLRGSLGVLRQENLSSHGFIANEVQLVAKSRKLLQRLDDHFCYQTVLQQKWLCDTTDYSILDIQMFPLVALSMDVGIVLDDYLHLRRWLNRIRQLKGFIPMPGLLEA